MRERDIFIEALEKVSSTDRAAYLHSACGADTELRNRVESLLLAHERQHSFILDVPLPKLDPSLALDPPPPPPPTPPGTIIGRYKLLQPIGEGGYGVVFMAEQSSPVQRKVALKLIKAGMDTRQVIARFEAERQALALMEHPNIAKVFDAGTTDTGRSYFVMELVRGVPITKYCDEHRLEPRQRLELFMQVCQAVQHAHQKGIIHRDLKPSNVLVAQYDGKPVAKVIDFGIAKATGKSLTDGTMFTGFGDLVGTLEYMSPEQTDANQIDVDTRSDIYSLGVLLYELLTGSTPLENKRVRKATVLELMRLVREEEPPRPSTRLSAAEQLPSIAACRGLEPKKLSALVHGELDWIVMKALEKDRTRRYETAYGMARDVLCYLNDEAVQACPPTAAYRFRKFARRNKRALVPAVLMLFFVVLAGGGIGWVLRDRSAQRATTERDGETALFQATQLASQRKWPEALASVQRAEGILSHGSGSEALRRRAEDLRKDLEMVARLDEIRLQGTEVKDEYFDRAGLDPEYRQAFLEYGIDVYALDAAEAAGRIRAKPIAVELAAALDDWACGKAGTYQERLHLSTIARLADPDPWRNRVRDAWRDGDVKALEELAAVDLNDRVLPRTLYLLDAVLKDGALEHRVTFLRRAQQRYPDDFWINTSLGISLTEQVQPARPQEAVRFFTAAVAVRPQSPGANYNLGVAFLKSGSCLEAIAAFRDAVRLKPDYAGARYSLGNALSALGEVRMAADEYEAARPLFTLHLGADHLRTLLCMRKLGRAYLDLERNADALKLYDEMLTLCTAKLGPDDILTISSKNGVAQSYDALGRYAEALKLYEELLTFYKSTSGPDHTGTLVYMQRIASCYHALGRDAEAAEFLEKIVNLRKAKSGPKDADTLSSVDDLAAFYGALGRHADALKLFEETLKLRKATLGLEHPETLHSMSNVATCYHNLGRNDEALKLREEVLPLYKRKLGPDHPDTLNAMHDLAASYAALGRQAEAVELGEQVLAMRKATLGLDHPSTLNMMSNLARSYDWIGRHEDALKLREDILAGWKRKLGLDHPATLAAMADLAGSYMSLHQDTKAVTLLEEIVTRRKAVLGADHPDTLSSMHDLGCGYASLGRHPDAVKIREETVARRKLKLGADDPNTLHSMWGLAESLMDVDRPAEAVAMIDECVRRGAGQTGDPGMIPRLIGVRLRYFEKIKDAAGCRATAEMWENLKRTDSGSLYDAACWRAVTAAVIRASDASEAAAKQAEAEADRAMIWLSQAVAAGYNNVAHIKEDADLNSLRSRDDFRKLLQELEAASKPT